MEQVSVMIKQSLRGYIPTEAFAIKKGRRNCTAIELVARATTAVIAASAETASTTTALFASLGFVDV